MRNLLNRKPKPDPGIDYEVVSGYVANVDGRTFKAVAGTWFRGDHPAVRAAFAAGLADHWFAGHPTRGERHAANHALESRARTVTEPDAVTAARRAGYIARGPIPSERRVRATRTLFTGNAVACFAGDLRDAQDPFVRQHQRWFVAVPTETPDAAA